MLARFLFVLQCAVACFALGSNAAAASVPESGCSEAPSVGDLEINRARRLYERNKAGEARTLLDSMVASEAVDPQSALRAGALLSSRDEHDRASAAFERVLERTTRLRSSGADYPGGEGALALYEAAALSRLGKELESSERINQVKPGPRSYRRLACHWVAVVRARFDGGKRAAAMELLRALIEENPGQRSLYDELVRLAFASKDNAVIEGALALAAEKFPNDTGFLVRIVSTLKRSKKMKEAQRYLDDALARDLWDRGLMRELLGLIGGRNRAREALPRYRRLAKKSPDSKSLPLVLAALLHHAGEYEASKTIFLRAGQTTLDRYPALNVLAATNLLILGDKKQSKALLERIVGLENAPSRALLLWGVLMVEEDPARGTELVMLFISREKKRLSKRHGEMIRMEEILAKIQGCSTEQGACAKPEIFKGLLLLAIPDLSKNERAIKEEATGQADPEPAGTAPSEPSQNAAKTDSEEGRPWRLFGGAALTFLILGGALWFRRRS